VAVSSQNKFLAALVCCDVAVQFCTSQSKNQKPKKKKFTTTCILKPYKVMLNNSSGLPILVAVYKFLAVAVQFCASQSVCAL
jgi:hypothetical protein